MKSSELSMNVDYYGVVPSWSYSNKNARDPFLAERKQLAKARLVSLDRYVYEVWRTADEHAASFKKTDASKKFGYKVTDGTQYWIARPQDIVAPYATLEARWAVAEAAQIEREAEQERRRLAEAQRSQEEHDYAANAKQTLEGLIRQITGRPAGLTVQTTTTRDSKLWSYAQMDLRTLEALVERFLDLQEA